MIDKILNSKIGKWLVFWGGIASICAIAFASFSDKKPKMEFKVLAENALVNKTEDVASIRILIDTIDIKDSRQNISVVLLKVGNNGREDIACGDYDNGAFGLKLSGCKLLEIPSIIEASTQHLKNRFEIESKESTLCDSMLILPKLPLDVGDYYTVRFALLTDDSVSPLYSVEGKISGQDEISLGKSIESSKSSIFEQAVSGKITVQALRLFLYFFCGFFLLFLFGLGAFSLDTLHERRRRKKILGDDIKSKKILPLVSDEYIKYGEYRIQQIYDVLKLGEQKINENYAKSLKFVSSASAMEKKNKSSRQYHRNRIATYESLKRAGYITITENKILIDDGVWPSVNKLYSILEEKSILPIEEGNNDGRVILYQSGN